MTQPENTKNNYAKIPIWFMGILLVIVMAAITWGATMQSKVAVLESNYENINAKLDRIERKIDRETER